MSIHVFGEVQGPTSTGDLQDEYFKNISECSHKPQNFYQHVVNILIVSAKFSGPVRIQGNCDMTLHLKGVHICHILQYWLRRLYRYSLSAKK